MVLIATGRLLQASLRLLFGLLVLMFAGYVQAFPTYELTRGQWSLISLPADPGSNGTVEFIFGDDLSSDEYGSSGGWLLLKLNVSTGQYENVEFGEVLSPNTGYWMIQQLVDSAELDVPDSLKPLAGNSIPVCPQGRLCVARPLETRTDGVRWNLVGFSSDVEATYGDTRLIAANSNCSTGCTPEQALTARVANSVLYRYNPNNVGAPYETVTAESTLRPWDAYWLAVLPNVQSPEWILPVDAFDPNTVDPAEGENDNPNNTQDAARFDAARLLMQGSFGPSTDGIDNVLATGGPEGWIDAQLALPASLHLPIVKSLFPNKVDEQRGRYTAFWDRALNADDQLRQRMAYALSHILVISGRPAALFPHGNLTAAYYDLLVTGAFGNFRDLLEDVTLSPAMGVYLSMLGNNKPDEASGRRADENYARELMQLFSIGLVGLNIDGTEQDGVLTYEQSDVENLARVLTGWSWDSGSWRTNARYGWTPDRTVMERPMVSYPQHHDVDEKQFLGMKIPADQTAEADLKMALDKLFNHPNVGPFIASQLIKRLVTSNPSPGYVARVATVFNDNGDGVRGDLAAVVRAILLDQEARDKAVSNHPEFGKLRESILRYSHVLRAFNVTDTVVFKQFWIQQLPQLVPLTAPSVFNYFSPKYSPPGAIADAGLVAPEFQLNSESNTNKVNKALMRIFHEDRFTSSPLVVNLNNEISMLPNVQALISHLDVLLTAGTLSSGSRQLLTDYIYANRGVVPDSRLLKDIVALVVSSTEFAIQR